MLQQYRLALEEVAKMQSGTKELTGLMEMVYILIVWWLCGCIHLSKLVKPYIQDLSIYVMKIYLHKIS